MPSTYTLISSNVLSSSAASVTFSAIPSTYTDLVVRISARTDRASQNNSFIAVKPFNSDTGTNYSYTILTGNGAAASTFNESNVAYSAMGYVDATTATSNTYASLELYIPSYTASQNKPISTFGAHENNATTAYLAATAGLWRNTAAITGVTIDTLGQGSFIATSSFYLYGIKNS